MFWSFSTTQKYLCFGWKRPLFWGGPPKTFKNRGQKIGAPGILPSTSGRVQPTQPPAPTGTAPCTWSLASIDPIPPSRGPFFTRFWCGDSTGWRFQFDHVGVFPCLTIVSYNLHKRRSPNDIKVKQKKTASFPKSWFKNSAPSTKTYRAAGGIG